MMERDDEDARTPDDPWDDDPWKDEPWPEPSRAPTTREKISVLLPALLAFGGMILMLLIFLAVALWRN
jgi:hypothetical protein